MMGSHEKRLLKKSNKADDFIDDAIESCESSAIETFKKELENDQKPLKLFRNAGGTIKTENNLNSKACVIQ